MVSSKSPFASHALDATSTSLSSSISICMVVMTASTMSPLLVHLIRIVIEGTLHLLPELLNAIGRVVDHALDLRNDDLQLHHVALHQQFLGTPVGLLRLVGSRILVHHPKYHHFELALMPLITGMLFSSIPQALAVLKPHPKSTFKHKNFYREKALESEALELQIMCLHYK